MSSFLLIFTGDPSLIANRYIVDYTFMDLTNPDGPLSRDIDEDSQCVTAFGIWPSNLVAERRPIRVHRQIS